jgi:hypothetical protein
MQYILPLIILAGLVLGWRIYTITTYFGKNSGQKTQLAIQLPASFYFSKVVSLLAVGLFFFALDPVPAGLALAGAFGIMLDTLLSVYVNSIRAVQKTTSNI